MNVVEIVQVIMVPMLLGIVNYIININKQLTDFKIYCAEHYTDKSDLMIVQRKLDMVIDKISDINIKLAKVEEWGNVEQRKKRAKKSIE